MVGEFRVLQRRVLRVPRGKVSDYLEEAERLGIPEIEERDDVAPGQEYIHTEEITQAVPIDYRVAWQAATTVEEKLAILGRLLGLQ